jgi:hypothetical protein
VSQQQLLAEVVRVLEGAGIPYMLTGSVVSSFFGHARTTHDIDIVVQIRMEQVAQIAAAFSADHFSFDALAARNAIAARDMFRLMDFRSGDKVDFWVLKDEPFDQQAFARRYRDTITGVPALLPTPEDLILQKLKWAHDFESEKQYTDALSVFELQAGKLDLK